MTPQLTLRLACLASLATALTSTASAQDAANYPYVGLSAGQSHSMLDENATTDSLLGAGKGASVLRREQQDTAYKVFGGYQFNRNIAVEGGYFNLGKFTFNSASPTGTLNGQYEVEGINLDLIGTVPLGESFSVFGRIGAQYALTRDSFSGTGTLTPANGSQSKRDTNLKVGLGLQYDISPSVQLRGEAERYRINDGFDNRGDVNVFSMSLVFPIGRASRPIQVAQAPAPYVAPAPAPVYVAPPPAPVAVIAPPPPPPAPRRVQLSADSLFGFNKSALDPDGKSVLDTFARDTRGAKFDSISVEGNTDRLGSAAYNQKLSEQRAEAVKAYLSSTSDLQSAVINAKGNGETKPMTKPGECVGNKPSKALVACLQADRRVDVEMTGLR